MSVKIVVDNRLRIARSDLPAEVVDEIKQRFTYRNPQYLKKKRMKFWTGNTPATISTLDLTVAQISLPRGGTNKLRSILAHHGLTATWLDRRVCHAVVDLPAHQVVLRPYQEAAVAALAKREQCLLRAPTGSGKTTTALALIVQLRQPSLVILWSANLLKQWQDRCQAELGMDARDLGLIQGGTWRLRPLTLAMQQSLWARQNIATDLAPYFGLILLDEVQRCAARTVRNVVDLFPARYRFGISADESRKDGLEFLTHDVIGRVEQDIPLEDLVESGAVLDVEIRVWPTDVKADWYRPQNEESQGASTPDYNRLLEQLCSDEFRNQLILDVVRAERESGQTILAFTHRREHARWLADEALAGEGCGLLLGGSESAERFSEDKARLQQGRIQIAIGTVQAIGQGLDLPAVSRGIALTPIAGNRQNFGQVRGRICRPAAGKQNAILHVVWDRWIFPHHLRNLIRWNSTVTVMDGNQIVAGRDYLTRWEPVSRVARSG